MKANLRSPARPEQSIARAPNLIETLQYYSDLFTFAPLGVVVLAEDSRVEDINRSAASMLGWPRSWIAGQLFSRWIGKNDAKRFLEHLQNACRHQRPLTDTFRIKDRRGRTRDVRFDSVAMISRDKPGRVRRCQMSLTELTEQRNGGRAGEGIDDLAHAMRLNSCGEMAAALAHELSQPLGAIRLYCTATINSVRAEDPAAVEGLLEKISAAAAHADATIQGLRAFLSKRDNAAERLDLNDIVNDAAQLAAAYAKERSSRIELHLTRPLPAVKVNRVHVQQVLLNLLQNGIDAMQQMPASDRLVVVTSDQAKPAMLRVTVADAGPGMTAEQRRRAFEPFYTTKTNGMGMGLSISRSIIESYGGRLWPRNVRRGTAISFTIPTYEH